MLNLFKNKYKNAEMVKYWKSADSVEAKVMRAPEGHYIMQMDGEKYPFPGRPRGELLYGNLSPLKHQIKNKIFNTAWAMLEGKKPDQEIRDYLRSAWKEIYELSDKTRYDFLPFDACNPPIKEIWRAMDAVGCPVALRETICFILQEDDAYRMRFQWLVKFFPWFGKPTLKDFDKGLAMLEQAEVVDDMKERERLFRRIFMFMVKDSEMFNKFLKEVNWSKVGLTKADKYFFRAKYFKVDYPEYQY